MVYAGVPSFCGLGLEDGHVPIQVSAVNMYFFTKLLVVKPSPLVGFPDAEGAYRRTSQFLQDPQVYDPPKQNKGRPKSRAPPRAT